MSFPVLSDSSPFDLRKTKAGLKNMEIIEVNEKKEGTDIDYYNNVSNPAPFSQIKDVVTFQAIAGYALTTKEN